MAVVFPGWRSRSPRGVLAWYPTALDMGRTGANHEDCKCRVRIKQHIFSALFAGPALHIDDQVGRRPVDVCLHRVEREQVAMRVGDDGSSRASYPTPRLPRLGRQRRVRGFRLPASPAYRARSWTSSLRPVLRPSVVNPA
jgi:hypothetical protein